MENREIQLDLYGLSFRADAAVYPSDCRILYAGAGGGGLCRAMPAHIYRGLRRLGAGMAIIQAFNGAGDTMTPTWINVFCFWVVQVPLAYTLSLGLGLGPVGVFWSVFVADILTDIVGYLVFRRGKWKLRMV